MKVLLGLVSILIVGYLVWHNGQTIFGADAHRDDWRRFGVRAEGN